MPVPRRADGVRVKTCRDCGETKDLEEFYLARGVSGARGGDGRRSRCIECFKAHVKATKDVEAQKKQQRERRREQRAADPDFSWRDNLKRYCLTPESYDEMLRAQGGVCLICKGKCSTGTRLSVDHDHSCCPTPAHIKRTCGKCNRGLLCRQCNRGLGIFGDSPETLRAAANYLETRSA